MSAAPWSVVDTFDDVEDKLNAFHQISNHILDLHAPIENVKKVRSPPNPYVTVEIISLMRIRDNWRKLARKSNDSLAWAAYKNFKTEVKRELRSEEQEYIDQQIRNNPSNTGCIWKTIQACIPKKSASHKAYSEGDKLVADEFNEFFTSVGQCNYDLAKSSFVPRCNFLAQQFSFGTVDCKKVEKVIK